MARIPLKARGRGNRFFEAEGVDELLGMVLELTAEVSAIRERQFITEQVLEEHGVLVEHGIRIGDEIDAYQLSPEEEAKLADNRKHLINRVLRTLDAAPAGDENVSATAGVPGRTRAA